MVEDYVCKFCNHGFSNGDQLEVHMRRHLGALVLCCKKQSIVKNYQDFKNFVKEQIKKNEESLSFYEGYVGNSYGLRENPKKTWRVSVLNPKSISDAICKQCGKEFSSLMDLECHMRSHSVKKMCIECGQGFDTCKALYWHMRSHLVKKVLCGECGKGFDTYKALYGHMRCHTIKKSQPCEKSTPSSSSSLEDGKLDEGLKWEISSSIRRKRSWTLYKPAKPNDPSSSTSLSVLPSNGEDYDNEAGVGALGLMMLSRGFRDSDLIRAKRLIFTHHKLVVSVDGSILFTKKEGFGESGSGQDNMEIVKNNAQSTGEDVRDKGKGKACLDQFDTDLRKSKGHICSVCFKEFGSGQALGGHKRAHYNVNKTNETGVKEETGDSFDICGRLDIQGGIKDEDDSLDMGQQ